MVALLGSANLVGIGAFAGGAGRDGQQQNYTNHCFHNFCPCTNKLEYADAGGAGPAGRSSRSWVRRKPQSLYDTL